MGIALRREGRDDFLVEKDKCVMSRSLQAAGLRILPTLGMWASLGELIHALASGLGETMTWPAYLKACHITQGEARSVKMLPSREWVSTHQIELQLWVQQKWALRANDRGRPWTEASNALTNVIPPGFFLVGPASTWSPNKDTPAEKRVVLELKVEVVWGRAYLAMENSYRITFLRDSTPTPALPFCLHDKGEIRSIPRSSWWAEIYRDGYLPCVWDLAERTAQALAADTLRVDVFLMAGDPTGCAVNEISLSSAMNYGPNDRYLTLLWIEPHLRGLYALLKATPAVYSLNGSASRFPTTPPELAGFWWWWWCGPCPEGSLWVGKHAYGSCGTDGGVYHACAPPLAVWSDTRAAVSAALKLAEEEAQLEVGARPLGWTSLRGVSPVLYTKNNLSSWNQTPRRTLPPPFASLRASTASPQQHAAKWADPAAPTTPTAPVVSSRASASPAVTTSRPHAAVASAAPGLTALVALTLVGLVLVLRYCSSRRERDMYALARASEALSQSGDWLDG